jgi:hypothetical protein
VNRSTRGAIPHKRRLSLICDPDARDLDIALEHLTSGSELTLPELFGVMLHPAWLAIVLRELCLSDPLNVALSREEERARRGRSLIEG